MKIKLVIAIIILMFSCKGMQDRYYQYYGVSEDSVGTIHIKDSLIFGHFPFKYDREYTVSNFYLRSDTIFLVSVPADIYNPYGYDLTKYITISADNRSYISDKYVAISICNTDDSVKIKENRKFIFSYFNFDTFQKEYIEVSATNFYRDSLNRIVYSYLIPLDLSANGCLVIEDADAPEFYDVKCTLKFHELQKLNSLNLSINYQLFSQSHFGTFRDITGTLLLIEKGKIKPVDSKKLGLPSNVLLEKIPASLGLSFFPFLR